MLLNRSYKAYLLTLSPETASWEMAKCTLMVGLVEAGDDPDTRFTVPLQHKLSSFAVSDSDPFGSVSFRHPGSR